MLRRRPDTSLERIPIDSACDASQRIGVMKGSASVPKAVLIGLLWVNGPVAVLLAAPLLALDLANKYGFIPRSQNWLILLFLAAGVALAWLWCFAPVKS